MSNVNNQKEDEGVFFDIEEMDRILHGDFIEVPVIHDFEEFKKWFNGLDKEK